ncbi:MAG: DegT/DnrJ/EryC1/StrS family aminotransferase [Parvularculaceae bacterium]|nr:DegT/DnrJ/EryC1/StrS family aminotransferase [Parvularculaceae bacterium]
MPPLIPHSRPSIAEADVAAVAAQMRTGMIAEGATAASFESRLAARYGFDAAIAVGSGCQAMFLALTTLGLPTSARVALPAYVCPEVLGVVEAFGVVPLIADVGADFLLDMDDPALRAADAVVAPALFGFALTQRHAEGNLLIADFAHYVPHFEERPAFDLAFVSFGATKMLTAGEGGAVLVNGVARIEAARAAKRVSGSALKLNLYPMSDLAAALGLAQLDRLEEMLARRRLIADRYAAAIRRPLSRATTPFRVLVEVDDVDAAITAFAARGVAARRPVDPTADQIRPQTRAFPVTARLHARTLSLPCHPSLSDAEVDAVVDAARAILT